MSKTDCSSEQLTFWKLGKQQVTADFRGGPVVSDAGLLAVRRMERGLGVLSELARRLPDPRSQKFVTHDCQRILVQGVYQILAGYFDYNDANDLRDDPLFQLLADVSPDAEEPLASGSTLARFGHAYTRREADRPREERSTLFECRRAHLDRIRMLNEYFVELFIKTRRRPPKRVILDLDATDDETHGGQQLTLFHGHYGQHQYYPLLVFDGETGFPLGAWLRHGTAAASLGAAEEIERTVQALKAVWPNVEIIIRGDGGFATPEMYECCEELELKYAFGYSSNNVLKRRTELKQRYALALCELYDEKQQFFQVIDDYQADGWPHPRPIIAKVEAMPQGINRRFVVSNLDGSPAEIYHGFYVKRGNVPERPIGQLKNGLAADRLSSPRFLANAWKLECHVLAYAIYVLFQEANESVPEVAGKQVATLRQQLFKTGAVVETSVRRIWIHFASHWPRRSLFIRICEAVDRYLAGFLPEPTATGPPRDLLWLG